MLHSVTRLRGMRMAVVVVERRQLAWSQAEPLISDLQAQLQVPVMLVARDDAHWSSAKSAAQFDSMPYLFELLARRDEMEWSDLPEVSESKSPF